MVLKRNGQQVEFDLSRIKTAIKKAMLETNDGIIDLDLIDSICKEIKLEYTNKGEFTVEQIQDLVEEKLMSSNRKDVAKKYILYRQSRNLARLNGNRSKYKLLSDEFLSKYKHLPNPMTALGEFVYYRTYSRWIEEEKRREFWWETCARTIDYNCNLVDATTTQEAERLFDNMFYLRQFLSGRAMWISGTKSVEKHPSALFNCSHIAIDNFNAYKDICYLLMLGCGVGFNVQKTFVKQLPKIKSGVQITHKDYNSANKNSRKEITEYSINGEVMEIIVGDSKIAWSQAIDYLIKVFYQIDFVNVKLLVLNYDNVRPFGEPLKTFGGKASGHDALKTILSKIFVVLSKNNTSGKYLKPIECMDIANIIAEGIVVGGTRRSAEMCLFDADDEDIKNAKTNLYIQDDKGVWSANEDIIHRMMSNNSVAFYQKPTFEDLKKRFETIKASAEGNFFNMESARKRKPNAIGTNPCGEILLDSKSYCNLTTINMMAFVKNGKLDKKSLFEAQRLSARAGYRVTTIELELPEWNNIQKRDRLIGCSMTGYQDMVNATNLNVDEQKTLLDDLKNIAVESAKEYANELLQNIPELSTCVKPEGSLSLLPTVSSGVHFSHSPYYIRRIRINAQDPLAKVCEELGYPMYPENGQDLETCTTKVIEFPVKAPDGKTKYDVSAIEQLEIYKMFMENYVEHNASNTISVRANEWEDVIEWVYNNWDSIVGVTFISLDDSFYQLLPYETITKEEYEKRVAEMKPFKPSLISKYEVEEMELDIGQSECTGGVCPIR